jgi:hypothetical protein
MEASELVVVVVVMEDGSPASKVALAEAMSEIGSTVSETALVEAVAVGKTPREISSGVKASTPDLPPVEQKADQIVIEIDRREFCGAVSHLVPSVKFRHKCGSVRTALAPILETRKRPALQGRAFALPSGSVGVGGVHSYVGSRTRTREVPVKLAT